MKVDVDFHGSIIISHAEYEGIDKTSLCIMDDSLKGTDDTINMVWVDPAKYNRYKLTGHTNGGDTIPLGECKNLPQAVLAASLILEQKLVSAPTALLIGGRE
jgi:hypothetical protein